MVWKFNTQKNVFESVPKKLSKLAFIATQDRTNSFLDPIKKGIDVKIKNLPAQQRLIEKKKLTAKYVTPFLDTLNDLKPK